MKIGKAIASIRKEKELKQVELAKLIGITNSYLSEIENDNRNPDLVMLEKICNALDVPIAVFILKATNEADIRDPSRKRLVREIKPLLDRITTKLYNEDEKNRKIPADVFD